MGFVAVEALSGARRTLEFDDEGWSEGSGLVSVHTRSGATYALVGGGKISGGSKAVRNGQLIGAVADTGGAICLGCVVVGMSIEISTGRSSSILTTPVTHIERLSR